MNRVILKVRQLILYQSKIDGTLTQKNFLHSLKFYFELIGYSSKKEANGMKNGDFYENDLAIMKRAQMFSSDTILNVLFRFPLTED